MRKLAARIFVLILAALVVLVVYVAAHVIATPSMPYYTDGLTIRQELAGAPLRQVLWNPPAPLESPVVTAADEHEAHISPDGQRLYFARGRPGHDVDLYVAQRTSEGWGQPRPLAVLNTPADELGPALAPDGRTLFFHSNRAGGAGGFDLWSTERVGADAWAAPVNLGLVVNSADDEYGVSVALDGRTLYFASNRHRPEDTAADAQDYDLYAVERGAGFGAPYPLDDLNSPADEGAPALSPVADFLYFASNRPGGRGGFDIYRSRRMPDGFAAPANLDAPVNTAANEIDPAVAEQGFVLIFSSDRSRGASAAPGYDLYASASREVFRASEDRGVPWGAILRLVGPLLPWVIVGILVALLLPLLVKLLRGDSERLRPLSMLARCVLLSLVAHAMIVLVSMAWAVASGIPEMMGRSTRGTRVALTSQAIGNRVAIQIRGALAESDTLEPSPAPLLRVTPGSDEPVEARPGRLAPGVLFAAAERPRPTRDSDDAAPQTAVTPVRDVDVAAALPIVRRPVPSAPLDGGQRVTAREGPAPTAAIVDAASARTTTTRVERGRAPGTDTKSIRPPATQLPEAATVWAPAAPADAMVEHQAPRARRPVPTASQRSAVDAAVTGPPRVTAAESGPDPVPDEPARPARTRAAAPTPAPVVTVSVAPEVGAPGAPRPTTLVRQDREAPTAFTPTQFTSAQLTRIAGALPVGIEPGRAPSPPAAPVTTGPVTRGSERRTSLPVAAPVDRRAALTPGVRDATSATTRVEPPRRAPTDRPVVTGTETEGVAVTPLIFAVAAPVPDPRLGALAPVASPLPARIAVAEGASESAIGVPNSVAPRAGRGVVSPPARTASTARLGPDRRGLASSSATPGAAAVAREAAVTKLIAPAAPRVTVPAPHEQLAVGAPRAENGAPRAAAAEAAEVFVNTLPQRTAESRHVTTIGAEGALVPRLAPAPARGPAPVADASRLLPPPRVARGTVPAVDVSVVGVSPTAAVVASPVGHVTNAIPDRRSAPREMSPRANAVATGRHARVEPHDVAIAVGKTRVVKPGRVRLTVAVESALPAVPGPAAGPAQALRESDRVPPLARNVRGSVPAIAVPVLRVLAARSAPAMAPRDDAQRRVASARVAAPPLVGKPLARVANVKTVAPRQEEASRSESRIRSSPAAHLVPLLRPRDGDRLVPSARSSSVAVRLPDAPVDVNGRAESDAVPPITVTRRTARVRHRVESEPNVRPRATRLPVLVPGAPGPERQTPPRVALPGVAAALPSDTPRLPEARDGRRLPALPPITVMSIPENTRPTPYPQRRTEQRAERLEKFGGNAGTEKAVADALDWLMRHQAPDGRWDGTRFDEDCGRCNGAARREVSTAVTAMALLSYFAADHTHVDDGPYRDTVARGVEWLLTRQSQRGDFISGETMYTHGAATIALAEVYGISGDEALREPLERAVGFVINARNRFTGGWRYVPGQDGDTSVLGWQVMALISAQRAGIEVPQEALRGAEKWLRRVNDPTAPGRYAYRPTRAPTPTMTAEAMYVQQLVGMSRDDPSMETSARLLLDNLPEWDQSQSSYYWFYASLALFQHGGPAWSVWNQRMKETLLAHQVQSGPAAGSWPPDDVWAQVGGRVYQTALCALTLEVYYRYLPLYVDDR